MKIVPLSDILIAGVHSPARLVVEVEEKLAKSLVAEGFCRIATQADENAETEEQARDNFERGAAYGRSPDGVLPDGAPESARKGFDAGRAELLAKPPVVEPETVVEPEAVVEVAPVIETAEAEHADNRKATPVSKRK